MIRFLEVMSYFNSTPVRHVGPLAPHIGSKLLKTIHAQFMVRHSTVLLKKKKKIDYISPRLTVIPREHNNILLQTVIGFCKRIFRNFIDFHLFFYTPFNNNKLKLKFLELIL